MSIFFFFVQNILTSFTYFMYSINFAQVYSMVWLMATVLLEC